MNGYNFTERVRKMLALSRSEAIRLNHEYLGTEHLLLGLIHEGGGVGPAVLQNLAIDTAEVVRQVETLVKRGSTKPPMDADLPYTSRAAEVLKLAVAEAKDLKHKYVGTEHLLLGILLERKSIAAQILAKAGASTDIVRAETLRILWTS